MKQTTIISMSVNPPRRRPFFVDDAVEIMATPG